MFRIPIFYKETPTFAEATNVITRHGTGDLLGGMKSMVKIWNDHCELHTEDDDEFFENWCYEVNAYNVVHKGMSQLFAPA